MRERLRALLLLPAVMAGSAAMLHAEERVRPPSRLDPVVTATPPTWSSGVYEYDGAGNIKKIGTTSNPNGDGRTNTFVYDTAGRLVSAGANYEATNSETYEYDSFGNLKKISTTISGSTVVNTIAVDDTTNRVSTATYDDAGNVTWDGVLTSYSWDALGSVTSKQTSGASEEYIYTASGERIAVRNTLLDHWLWTLRDLDGKVLREYKSSPGGGNAGSRGPMAWVEDYIHRGGALAAAVRPTSQGGTRHFHLDHLGTPRLVTDSNGYAFGYHDYFPFGAEITSFRQEMDSRGLDRPEPMRFTGHERDFSVTAYDNKNYVDYMHARYYGPMTGRFLSIDPGRDWDIHKPQSWNMYVYVQNNPVLYTDPTGKSLWRQLFLVIRYIGREARVVARVRAISKRKAMEGIERGIKVAREEKATSIAVATQTKQARKAVGEQLATSRKTRPPERSGIWPEHVNPADGPNADVHVQTVADTKSAGFGKPLGMGILSIIGANTMAANANKNATTGEVTGAFIWDVAKTIDPIFLTDVLEYATGVDEYAQESPPE